MPVRIQYDSMPSPTAAWQQSAIRAGFLQRDFTAVTATIAALAKEMAIASCPRFHPLRDVWRARNPL